jgi:hypothetical protein
METYSEIEPCRLRVPCPVLPCPARAGQVTLPAGQGRVRLRKFLKGRLQVMNVITCQSAINCVSDIFYIFSKVKHIKKKNKKRK